MSMMLFADILRSSFTTTLGYVYHLGIHLNTISTGGGENPFSSQTSIRCEGLS